MRIVILGGGSAGWMTAAHLVVNHPEHDITLIESDRIPIIGVGESVTPHVSAFMRDLGLDERDWMGKTGGVIKLGNKFHNWSHGQGESEYFSFTYGHSTDLYYSDVYSPTAISDFRPRKRQSPERTIDHVADLHHKGQIDRYDQWAHSQYHYMASNTLPYLGSTYLLNQPWAITHHVNAELVGRYLRDTIALPRGVDHVKGTVVDFIRSGDRVTDLFLENGAQIGCDLLVDCSGMHRSIVGKLGWGQHVYEDYPVDRAWVTQTDYIDPSKEMVNHTQSIAEDFGWRFKISLYHRMGNGLCFSNRWATDQEALAYFKRSLGDNSLRREPKLIAWTPNRLNKFAEGNVIAIGLSSGFVEPMESNLLYITVYAIRELSRQLRGRRLDWTNFNQTMTWSFDDVHDFLLLHYTLTNREDTEFWRYQRARGLREGHHELARSKCRDPRNSVWRGLAGETLFPDYMWQQMVSSWGHHQPQALDPEISELAGLHIRFQETKHRQLAQSRPQNYDYLREQLFGGLTPEQWQEQYL